MRPIALNSRSNLFRRPRFMLSMARVALAIISLTGFGAALPPESQAPKPGIAFELGSSIEYVRVTPAYSNTVLQAILPFVSEVTRALDIPVPHPIPPEHVLYCSVLPNRRVEAEIGIKGGWVFAFRHGYVGTIQGPRYFFGIQDLDQIPQFFGQVNMTKPEAIQLARDTIKKLGISLESVFAEQEPRVTGPLLNGTNTIPHYRIEWLDPRSVGQAPAAVEFDIDAETKRVARIELRCRSLERPPPKVGVVPPRDDRFPVWPQVSLEYASRLLPIVLASVQEYAQKLALPIPKLLTTNHVIRFSVADNGGWPHSELELTNGWRFIYRNSMVNGFYAPDNLFNSDNRPILIKDFLGKWHLREPEAQDLVRRTLEKLNYPTNLVHFEVEPQVNMPAVPGIPRYMFYWYFNQNNDLQSTIWAEVDADKGELKSLYYDDKTYWNKPPPVGLPISQPATNQPQAGSSLPSRLNKKPPRPQSAFNPPKPK